MIGALLVVSVLASTPAPALHCVREPFDVWAPAAVATRWERFDELASTPGGEIPLRVEGAPDTSGRVDVLRREGSRWVWLDTYRFVDAMHIPSSDEARAVLLRFESTPFYFWYEVPSRSVAPVHLLRNKNLAVIAEDEGALLTLFVSSSSEPRRMPTKEHVFRCVPVEAALVCTSGATGGRCIEAVPTTTHVHVPAGTAGGARVLRVEPQTGDAFQALAPGRIAIRPKKLTASVATALPWIGITVDDPNTTWEQVVLDRTGDAFALQRLTGSALAPLPAATSIASERARGLIIRPWIGAEKHRFTDASAMLLVFIAGNDDGIAGNLPIATVAPTIEREFRLPTLGSGRYALKLLSSETTADLVMVSAIAGVPADVVFATGPTVVGRVVRFGAGPATEPATIEIGLLALPKDALKNDPLDKVRFARSDENGAFHVVLGSPGTYRLHARWGSAAADRDFVISKESKNIELGEIVLGTGATLRGTIDGCSGGQAILIAVPDLSKAVTPGLGDLSRVAIGGDGRFFAEGLSVGSWSVLFQCGGTPRAATPEIIIVPDTNDVVVRFTQAVPQTTGAR